jgi:hypothetical protein
MNGNGNTNGVRLGSLVLAFVIAVAGALAYLHSTFVTYREFTAVLERIERSR